MTLYAFDGDPVRESSKCRTAACRDLWTPLAAAQLAIPAGDFGTIDREDGMTQWAYKGNALYTFKLDVAPGNAKGMHVDKRWQVALVRQFFMPPQVRIEESPGRGKILATADGMTLYRRNSYLWELRGHSLPHGVPIIPEMGKVIGARSCDAECIKIWRPFEAPANALSAGFWEVIVREDGKKQWSYKGYALYRYAGDKKPGEVNGVDIYDVMTNQHLATHPDALAAVASVLKSSVGGQVSLYWSDVYP
jgi:predicted lipoprotein with Yx(FWY)xxD motif